MKRAIIFGASGFIYSYLGDELLSNPDYERVIAVGAPGKDFVAGEQEITPGDAYP